MTVGGASVRNSWDKNKVRIEDILQARAESEVRGRGRRSQSRPSPGGSRAFTFGAIFVTAISTGALVILWMADDGSRTRGGVDSARTEVAIVPEVSDLEEVVPRLGSRVVPQSRTERLAAISEGRPVGEARYFVRGRTGGNARLEVGLLTLKGSDAIRDTMDTGSEAVLIIESGSVDVTLGDQRSLAAEGAAVYISAGTSYQIENRGASTIEYYFVRWNYALASDRRLGRALDVAFSD